MLTLDPLQGGVLQRQWFRMEPRRNHTTYAVTGSSCSQYGSNWNRPCGGKDMNQSLNLESRLKPHRGRAPRSESFATRFTAAEVDIIAKAAEAEGKTPREWSRDVLL